MPSGKPAGVRCIQLTPENLCLLFGDVRRPQVCIDLRPNGEMCGADGAAAMAYLTQLEVRTRP